MLNENEIVWEMNFSVNAPSWVKAVIQKKLGPVTYLVKLETGPIFKRHIDQLREKDKKNTIVNK